MVEPDPHSLWAPVWGPLASPLPLCLCKIFAAVEEIVAGLQAYFDRALPLMLLPREERQQVIHPTFWLLPLPHRDPCAASQELCCDRGDRCGPAGLL